MRKSSVASKLPDLTACDREPIHIPGSIQPHGFLMAVRISDMTVIQASLNCDTYIQRSADGIVGRSLADALGEQNARQVAEALVNADMRSRPMQLDAIELSDCGLFDMLAHVSNDLLILEFEPSSRHGNTDLRTMYALLRTFLADVREAGSIEAISQLAVRKTKEITGFGRVLLYRFDHHYHGQVVAEDKEAHYHSYLHQRFPASDIPRQARELYLRNHIRLIADAHYTPSLLHPQINPLTGVPTDLTYASLRSVSPVHLEYMRNMGTLSSMSVSLVVKGRLWGLLSCHNATARHLSFEARAACEQLGQILSLQLEAKEETEEYNHRLELRRALVAMLSAMSNGPDFVQNLGMNGHDLMRFANATGAAIVFEGRVVRVGDAPSEAEVGMLVQWLSETQDGDIFHTDALSSLYPNAGPIRSLASGIMAMPISKIHRHYLLWFRPEVVQTIEWAGNPHLKSETDETASALTPRRSFDIWKETVCATSLPWRKSEVETALEFRVALLGIVLRRAEEMASLAEELGRANKELESFSYSVSHDLRAPLRHIVGYTDLLSQYEGRSLTERGNRFLTNIVESARFAGKLVDDLLSFSQMGRAALRPRLVNTNDAVRSVISHLGPELRDRQVFWQIGELPAIQADPVFLQLAIQNLLSNAIKYTRTKPEAHIRVYAEDNISEHIFHFADNGVGFNMKYVQKLFGVFQRLHRMEEFEGTGIGLANVRRIIERHGGRTWAEGAPNEGAVFSFTIPKQLNTSSGGHHAQTDPAR